MNLYRPDCDDYQVVAAQDADEGARQTVLGLTVPPGELDKLLHERFRRHGTYLVRHDSSTSRA